MLQDKSPRSGEKHRSKDGECLPATEAAEPGTGAAAAGPAAAPAPVPVPEQQRMVEEVRRERSQGRDKVLGPRLFDKAVVAAVRDKRGSHREEGDRHHKRSRR